MNHNHIYHPRCVLRICVSYFDALRQPFRHLWSVGARQQGFVPSSREINHTLGHVWVCVYWEHLSSEHATYTHSSTIEFGACFHQTINRSRTGETGSTSKLNCPIMVRIENWKGLGAPLKNSKHFPPQDNKGALFRLKFVGWNFSLSAVCIV